MSDASPLKVLFAGTPDFSVPALQALAAAGHDITAVYTQPDRPAGRGRQAKPSAVKEAALELGLPIRQPASLKDAEALEELLATAADVMVVVAYGQILRTPVLNHPRCGCLNIHGSILPRWRGAAPIQRAVLAGDPDVGICIMQMDEGLDTGPVLGCRSMSLAPNATASEVHDDLARMGADLLIELLVPWCTGDLKATEQDHQMATYAEKLDKSEARIDWANSATDIHRRVCAFNAWPVAETDLDGARLRIWRSQVAASSATSQVPSQPPPPQQQSKTGQVVSCDRDGIVVQCGEGRLVITELQMPGKRPMTAAAFANGQDITGRCLK